MENPSQSYRDLYIASGITQYYLPPTKVSAPRLDPSQAGQYSILPTPKRRKAELTLVLVYTKIIHPSAGSHSSQAER